MLLLVGLGNPGARYARQRHNVGFMAVDAVAEAHGFPSWRSKFSSLVSEGRLASRRVLLLKPQTYMNRSGYAVGDAVRFFKLPLHDVVVCHDELDLAPGKVRIKTGGGVAGHNGLRSLAEHLSSRDFRRVRIGIGHPGVAGEVMNYVLSKPSPEDRERIQAAIDIAVETMPAIARGDFERAMNILHTDTPAG